MLGLSPEACVVRGAEVGPGRPFLGPRQLSECPLAAHLERKSADKRLNRLGEPLSKEQKSGVDGRGTERCKEHFQVGTGRDAT